MRNKIKVKTKVVLILLVFFFINLKLSYSQVTQILLSTPETGSVTHVASENINFTPNYHYVSTLTDEHHSYIGQLSGPTNYGSGVTTNQDLQRPINTSLAVGYTEGVHSVTPTGASVYNIPIILPPSTNGLLPQLGIVYNSGNGNGILGIGWNLTGISAISRAPKTKYHNVKIEPVKVDITDMYALDGNTLIGTSPQHIYGHDGKEYGTELESFSRIISHGGNGNGPEWFSVETKDGKYIEYGNTVDSKFLNESGTDVLIWRVNKVTDTYGNYMEFKYLNDTRNTRIDKILYTGNTVTGLFPYNKIQFYYDERLDENTTYFAGSSFNSKYLLKKIEVIADGISAREYHFAYGLNHYSFLKEIKEVGSDGGALNSTIFKYGDQTMSYENVPTDLILGTSGIIVPSDFNGDGFTDVLELDNGFSLYLNNKNNDYVLSASSPGGGSSSVSTQISALGDFDANGNSDMLVVDRSTFTNSIISAKVFTYQSGNFVQNYITTAFLGVNKIPNNDKFIFPGDFDGDGAMDFMSTLGNVTNNSKSILFFPRDNRDETLTNQDNLKLHDADEIIVMNFDGDDKSDILVRKGSIVTVYTFDVFWDLVTLYTSSTLLDDLYSVYPADFNGDGLTDLLISPDQINWTINYATGTSFNSSSFTFTMTPDEVNHKLKLGDYNGDGKTDIFHAYTTQSGGLPSSNIDLYYSTGTSFNYVQDIDGIDINQEEIISGDFNGDGKLDELKRPMNSANFMDVLYFNKSSKDFLLEGILDGFNRLTEFSYEPITNNNI